MDFPFGSNLGCYLQFGWDVFQCMTQTFLWNFAYHTWYHSNFWAIIYLEIQYRKILILCRYLSICMKNKDPYIFVEILHKICKSLAVAKHYFPKFWWCIQSFKLTIQGSNITISDRDVFKWVEREWKDRMHSWKTQFMISCKIERSIN